MRHSILLLRWIPTLAALGCGPNVGTLSAAYRPPPPPAITVDISAIAAGQQAVWEVYNAPAGAELTLVASRAGLGTGFCPPILGGSCLGLRAPVIVLGTMTADAGGHARFSRTIPATLGAGDVAFQVVWRGATPAWVSNAVLRTAQPGPLEHINTVYDDTLAGDWQIEAWPCASGGSPVFNLSSTTRVGSGSVAAAVNMSCQGGYSAFGFDRRSPNWSHIGWLYPNEQRYARFLFHKGAVIGDEASLDLTLDLNFRLPLANYLGQPDARGWYDVVVPLADLNPESDRFHRLMLFNSSPGASPEFVVDRFQVVRADDLVGPQILSVQVTDTTPDGGTLRVETDEHTRLTGTATGGGVTVSVAGADLAREHVVALTGLPPDTAVQLALELTDHQESGPAFASAASGSFRTAVRDTTGPLLSGFRVARTGATIATVCFTTDEPASAVVAFGAAAQSRSVADMSLVTDRCLNLTGLNPSTTYTWSATATDRWGNARSAASNLPFTTTTVPTATASVSRTSVVGAFPAGVRGANLGNWTMFWGRVYPDDSPRLRELTRLIKPGVLRHAGGNWSNEVMWDPAGAQCYPQRFGPTCRRETFEPRRDGWDTCGPSAVRVPGAYQHAYQPDELANVVDFADYVGAELMVEVNAHTCDPGMWADLVEYANLQEGWDIRYWEIGNEHDYNAHLLGLPFVTGADYAERLVRYAAEMKAVDPSISIVGPTASQHEEDPLFLAESDLLLPVLDHPEVAAGGVLDALSWHLYPHWNGEHPVLTEQLYAWGAPTDPSSRSHLDVCVPEKRGWLDDRGLTDTEIAITEFNGIVVGAPTQLNVNHAGALYLADALPRLARSGADLVLNWELYDDPDATGFGLISHNESTIHVDAATGAHVLDDRFTPNPAWYAYLMLAQWFGTELVATTSSRESLAVWASRDPARPGDVWVLVVNLSDDSVVGTIQLGGWVPSGGAKQWTLSNPRFVEAVDKESVVDGSVINGLSIDPTSAATIQSSWAAIQAAGVPLFPNANGVTRTFAAYTVTAILLDGP
jgi:hypothetical protein